MDDINYSNENYLKEMEKNARLFQEKMNKLEKMRPNSLKNNKSTQMVFKKQIKSYNNFQINNNSIDNNKERTSSNNFQKNKNNYIPDKYEYNTEKIYNTNSSNRIRNNNNNNYFTDNKNNINKNEIIQYKKRIEQLKNEIIDKDKAIKKLEKSLKEKENLPSEKQYEEVINKCENLKSEINEKIKIIKRTENENKELKMKIDNLVEQIKSMKETIKRKNDEIENFKMDIESLKEELSLNNKKMNNLEIQNKKLKIEYDTLNKDYQIIKNEKEKMNHELEENKATIFNYQKELSTNNKRNSKLTTNFDYDNYNYQTMNHIYNKKQDYEKRNLNEIIKDENDFEYKEENIKNKNIYNIGYSKEDSYKYENSKSSKLNKDKNINNNQGDIIRKKNYSNYDLENFNNPKKPFNTLTDLEYRLSYLISEKKKLENELLKMPEHPRNLNEIKIKKELNNKISDTEKEINSIKTKIRNFDY